jgi:hypothetical protein
MNVRTKGVVDRALDEALELQVVNLFGVLSTASSEDQAWALGRFLRGLKKATDNYENVLLNIKIQEDALLKRKKQEG